MGRTRGQRHPVNWRPSVDIDSIPIAFGHWLAGLTDGEGCFYISGNLPAFRIKLRDDDEAVIHYIHSTLKIGHIGHNKELNSKGINRRRTTYWGVNAKSEVAWLVRFFERFPLHSKKRFDYAVWREAVMTCLAGGSVAKYRAQLTQVRAYVKTELAEPTLVQLRLVG